MNCRMFDQNVENAKEAVDEELQIASMTVMLKMRDLDRY